MSVAVARPIDRLLPDTRGAVLLMGVFLGTTLVGALWYLIGISETVIFRERVQEAADAAAFSSAALHAKGMNFIAAMNVIMFAITSIWLALRLIEDIAQKIINIVGVSSGLSLNRCELREAIPYVGSAACPVSKVAEQVHDAAKRGRDGVGTVMETTFEGIGVAQKVVAVGTPFASVGASVLLGNNYGHSTVALDATLIPVETLANKAKEAYDRRKARGETTAPPPPEPTESTPLFDAAALGLPVTDKPFGDLCGRSMVWLNGGLLNLLKRAPGIGSVLSLGPIETFLQNVVDSISGAVQSTYCEHEAKSGGDSNFFKKKGFKASASGLSNGAQMTQIYAFTIGRHKDGGGHHVAIAGEKYDQQNGTSLPRVYTAQSEFFYDCSSAWSECDGDTNNVMFNMNWRARLRRTHLFDWNYSLKNIITDAVSTKVDQALEKVQEGVDGALKQAAVGALTDLIGEQVKDRVNGAIEGKIDDLTDDGVIPPSPYH